jgi:putative phosphoesterase
MRVGILADTHGVLRPIVLERLAGCDLLLHAGDVGVPRETSEEPILTRLARVRGPAGTARVLRVVAVRGNDDGGLTGAGLPPLVQSGELAPGLPFRMTHRREDVPDSWWREARLIVCGHSHRPELEWQGDCLLLNPGGCGSRRFRLPLTVGIVTVSGDPQDRLVPEILSVE